MTKFERYRAVNLSETQLNDILLILGAASHHETEEVDFGCRPNPPTSIFEFGAGYGNALKEILEKGIEVEIGQEITAELKSFEIDQLAHDGEEREYTISNPDRRIKEAISLICIHQLKADGDAALSCNKKRGPMANLSFYAPVKKKGAELLRELLKANFKVTYEKYVWKKYSPK